jgi:hypothetical protein
VRGKSLVAATVSKSPWLTDGPISGQPFRQLATLHPATLSASATSAATAAKRSAMPLGQLARSI